MSRPIAVATEGYLTGVARDIVSIMADGYLTSVVAKRRGGGRAREDVHFYQKFLRKEDDELLMILSAWIMEVGNANTR